MLSTCDRKHYNLTFTQFDEKSVFSYNDRCYCRQCSSFCKIMFQALKKMSNSQLTKLQGKTAQLFRSKNATEIFKWEGILKTWWVSYKVRMIRWI